MQVTNCRYTSPGLRCRIRSASPDASSRSEEHTSELQSQSNLVCRLLLEKKKSHEIMLLDTGGRIARVLPLLEDVFFVVNIDVFWFVGTCLRLPRATLHIPTDDTRRYCVT